MFGTLATKELGKFLPDVTLGDPAHVKILSGCHADLPTVRRFTNFHLSIVNRLHSLLNCLIGRDGVSTEADLPQIDDRTDRGFKGLIRILGYFQRLARHLRDFLRNRNPLSGAIIHFVQSRLLVHGHHIFVANDLVLDHLTQFQDFLFTRTVHLAGDDGTHVQAHPGQLVFFRLHRSHLRFGSLNRAQSTADKKESHRSYDQIFSFLHILFKSSFLTYDGHT